MSLARRLKRIEAELLARNSVADPWLVYDLHEWSKGTRGAFEQEELDNDHDRLVAVALARTRERGKDQRDRSGAREVHCVHHRASS